MKRIGLVMFAIGDLPNIGGAERFFAQVYDEYRKRPKPVYEINFLTDPHSCQRLQSIGRLSDSSGVVRLTTLGQLFVGDLQVIPITFQLLKTVGQRRFDLLHITLPSYKYLPALTLMRLLPKKVRPRIALNVVDCSMSHMFEHPMEHRRDIGFTVHRSYFALTDLDGVFTWYKRFKDIAERRRVIRSQPAIVAANRCCTDNTGCRPADNKDNAVVFAARMVPQKQPLMFVEAVKTAVAANPEAIKGWHFLMFGRGPLETTVREKIDACGLNDWITLDYCPDMSGVFARTKLFVSTQDYDNFSSMAMMEAMASGNAVVARKVGQTEQLVINGGNGFLPEEDSPAGIATAMLEYIRRPDMHRAMQQESVRLATQVHTIENCLEEIEDFWSQVLYR